jgi:hypothetical protein
MRNHAKDGTLSPLNILLAGLHVCAHACAENSLAIDASAGCAASHGCHLPYPSPVPMAKPLRIAAVVKTRKVARLACVNERVRIATVRTHRHELRDYV